MKIDANNVMADLLEAEESLEGREELALDFSGVTRINSAGLEGLQSFAHRAEDKNTKVALRGVNVNVYKTLKLARLTVGFSFEN
ncbi:MAG TPA: STAS domain-containing protein [Candidatus Sulfotelmatobacter sp.]